MNYRDAFYKLLLGLVVLTKELLPVCSSAVDACRNICDPGYFCSDFLGSCVNCVDFCEGTDEFCHTVCDKHIPTELPHSSTVAPNTRGITNAVNNFTPTKASATVITQSNNSAEAPRGEGGVSHEYSKLILGLVLFLCLSVVITLIWYCAKNYKSFQSPNACRNSRSEESPNDTDIELAIINSNNMGDETLVGHPTPSGPVPEHTGETGVAEDEAIHLRPGPYGLISPARHDSKSTNLSVPVQPSSTSCRPFQSASVQPTDEKLQGAVPIDRRPPKQVKQKTPETITDGTVKGHELAAGAPQLAILFQPGDMPWDRDSGQLE